MHLRPHPEERRSRVSKDGRNIRTRGHPSRRIACAMLLRMAMHPALIGGVNHFILASDMAALF
jgi:hypothetical protein